MSNARPGKRCKNIFQVFILIHLRKAGELALIHYYFIWAGLFGTGMLLRIKFFPSVMFSGYIHYLQIASIFIVLLIYIFAYIRNYKGAGVGRWGSKSLFLITLPAFVFFLIGFMIPDIGRWEAAHIKPGYGKENSIITFVQGRVNSHPETSYGCLHFDLAVESCQQSCVQAGDEFEIIQRNPGRHIIQRDDYIKVKGELRLSQKGLILMTSGNNIEFISGNGLPEIIFGFRQKVFNCIDTAFKYYLGYRYSSLAGALILGDRSGISGRQYNLFRNSGTAHLIAISGMHISFLAATIYMLLERIFKRSQVITAILAILLFYNFLLGTAASVVRATIWVLASAAAASWKRELKASYILCLSFIIIPIINPGFIEDAGFWLSFSAMAGIVFVYPLIKDTLIAVRLPERAVKNYFTGTFLAVLSIQLTCGPLLLYYFGRLPVISPISNLVILPLFYVLILLLFTAAFVCIIWPPAGGVVLKVTPIFFRAVDNTARFFSGSRFPFIEIKDISMTGLFIYYCSIVLMLVIIKATLRKRFDF